MARADSFLSNAQRWGKSWFCNEVCKYLQTLSKFLFKTFFCFRKSFLIFLLCKVEHCVFIFNFLFHIKNHSFFIIVVETGFHHVLVIIGAEKIKHKFYWKMPIYLNFWVGIIFQIKNISINFWTTNISIWASQ